MFDKQRFAQIIKNIKDLFNNQEEFAKKTHIGRTSLSQYMNMKLDKPPKPSTLEKLAKASQGITNYQELMQICGYIDVPYSLFDSISKKSYDVIKDKCNNSNSQEKANRMLDYIETHNIKNLAIVPIYGRIPAGEPQLAKQNIEGYIPIDPRLLEKDLSEYIYLRVVGNSMNQKFQDGDYVLIKIQSTLENGEIGVFLVNGDDATIKRYRQINKQIVLLEPMSDDTSYEPITVDLKKTSFKILGKAVNYFGKV